MNDASWTPVADRSTLHRLHWKAGLEINDFAELFGCSRGRIVTTFKRLHIQRRRRPLQTTEDTVTAAKTLDAIRALAGNPVTVENLRRHSEALQQLLYPPEKPAKKSRKAKNAKKEGDEST